MSSGLGTPSEWVHQQLYLNTKGEKEPPAQKGPGNYFEKAHQGILVI